MRKLIVCAVVATYTMGSPDGVAAQSDGAAWYVYHDAGSTQNTTNHGVWTVMPAQCIHNRSNPVEIVFNYTIIKPAAGDSSIRIDFDIPPDPGWCGVAVLTNAVYDNHTKGKKDWKEPWGAIKDDARGAFDLRKYTKLVFSARGETGGEFIEISAFRTAGNKFGDTCPTPFYTGAIKLDKDWQEYTYDLTKQGDIKRCLTLRRILNPFAVVATQSHNPGGHLTVYLDEIRFK